MILSHLIRTFSSSGLSTPRGRRAGVRSARRYALSTAVVGVIFAVVIQAALFALQDQSGVGMVAPMLRSCFVGALVGAGLGATRGLMRGLRDGLAEVRDAPDL